MAIAVEKTTIMIDKFLMLLGNLLTAGDLLYKAYDALKDWFKTKGWRN